MKFYCAPMQGFTEAAWRDIMAQTDCGIDDWCAPFVRIEKGEPRRRDIRDILPENNVNQTPIPQIIFKDTDEFRTLTDAVISLGYSRIDLNLGCPFPLQTGRGRGCGALANAQMLDEVAQYMAQRVDVQFSVKMRLGMKEVREWLDVADIVNAMPLHHITVHPRTAAMQYKGSPDLDEFERCVHTLKHPITYNGDIRTPEDISKIADRYSNLHGIMIGRGLIMRPTLVNEFLAGKSSERPQQIAAYVNVMQQLDERLSSILHDDNQVLAKLKPYWAESELTVGHKMCKAIKKARNLTAYRQAVKNVLCF